MSDQLTLLLMASNAVGTQYSKATEEIQAIDDAIQKARYRDHLVIEKELDLRVSKIGPALLKYSPDIVHLSGHGEEKSGLVLQNDLGHITKIPCGRLTEFFTGTVPNLRLAFFGFCHSAECVPELSKSVDFVLGINGEISVRSSLTFFPAFYHALASGQSVQQALEYGKKELRVRRYGGADAIILKIREGADPAASFIKSPTQHEDLKAELDRLVRGVGSEMDCATLRHAIDTGVLVLSSQESAETSAGDAAFRFKEIAGIYHAELPSDLYRKARELLHPTPPGLPPPFRPSVFVGREGALSDIRKLLTVKHRENITVVHGWPGVGKTSLVSAIGHDPEIGNSFKDGILWVSLEQTPNVIAEMARWGRALGSDEILRAPTVREATAQLGVLLRKRNMLLIVDDVWATGDAAAFTGAAGEQCSVLITTRLTSVADALTAEEVQSYNLPVLTEEFALTVLRILVPTVVSENEGECLELVRDLECLPLALHVAAGLLKSEDRLGWGVSGLIKRIREGTEILDKAAPKDRIGKDGVIPSVSALLHNSTNVLDDDLRDYFICLGAFAPKPAAFDLMALQAVWEVEDPKPIVQELVAHGLLEPARGGRFQMHRILVDHARSLCEEE